jgi:hypothetical protein
VAVVQEVIKEARTAHTQSGVEYRLDKRTLQRTLDRMQFTTGSIARKTVSPDDISRLAVDAQAEDRAWLEDSISSASVRTSIEVLIRTDTEDVESSIRRALLKRKADSEEAANARPLKQQHVAVDGETTNMTALQKERFRDLRGKRHLDDPLLFHTPLASAEEVDAVLHAASPGIFLGCLAFHYHITQGVRHSLEGLHSSLTLSHVDLVISEALMAMPVHFLLCFSEGFRGKVLECFFHHPGKQEASSTQRRHRRHSLLHLVSYTYT